MQFLRALPDDSSYREYGRCIPADHSNYLPFRPASPTSFTFPLSFDRARAVLIAVRRSTVAAAVYFTMSFSSDMQSTTAFSTDGSPRRARASKAAARSSQPVVAHRIRQRLGCCWIWIMCQLLAAAGRIGEESSFVIFLSFRIARFEMLFVDFISPSAAGARGPHIRLFIIQRLLGYTHALESFAPDPKRGSQRPSCPSCLRNMASKYLPGLLFLESVELWPW